MPPLQRHLILINSVIHYHTKHDDDDPDDPNDLTTAYINKLVASNPALLDNTMTPAALVIIISNLSYDEISTLDQVSKDAIYQTAMQLLIYSRSRIGSPFKKRYLKAEMFDFIAAGGDLNAPTGLMETINDENNEPVEQQPISILNALKKNLNSWKFSEIDFHINNIITSFRQAPNYYLANAAIVTRNLWEEDYLMLALDFNLEGKDLISTTQTICNEYFLYTQNQKEVDILKQYFQLFIESQIRKDLLIERQSMRYSILNALEILKKYHIFSKLYPDSYLQWTEDGRLFCITEDTGNNEEYSVCLFKSWSQFLTFEFLNEKDFSMFKGGTLDKLMDFHGEFVEEIRKKTPAPIINISADRIVTILEDIFIFMDNNSAYKNLKVNITPEDKIQITASRPLSENMNISTIISDDICTLEEFINIQRYIRYYKDLSILTQEANTTLSAEEISSCLGLFKKIHFIKTNPCSIRNSEEESRKTLDRIKIAELQEDTTDHLTTQIDLLPFDYKENPSPVFREAWEDKKEKDRKKAAAAQANQGDFSHDDVSTEDAITVITEPETDSPENTTTEGAITTTPKKPEVDFSRDIPLEIKLLIFQNSLGLKFVDHVFSSNATEVRPKETEPLIVISEELTDLERLLLFCGNHDVARVREV